MKRKTSRQIVLLSVFLAVVIALMVSACDTNTTRLFQAKKNSNVTQADKLMPIRTQTATKKVSHALGQVSIPIQPRRIVVLDDSILLEPLLALGIKPVGFAACFTCIRASNFRERIIDVPVLGDSGRISLEKVLSLKPDLILGHKWQQDIYPLLSAMAPTVLIDSDSGIDFKRDLRFVAEIVNRNAQVEPILSKYNKRVQEFRQQLGENLKSKTVSVLNLYGSEVVVYSSEMVTFSQVMRDAGIQFSPAHKNLKDSYLKLSIETLPDWDADFLFVVIDRKEDSEKRGSPSFLKQPVWSALRAVQNKKVYVVNWDVVGPITATEFVDNLYKYFKEIA